MSDTNETPQVESLPVNPAIQSAIDMLNGYADAYGKLGLKQQQALHLPGSDERQLVIDNLLQLNRNVKSGKVAKQHDDNCASWEKNQPRDENGALIPVETMVTLLVDSIPQALRALPNYATMVAQNEAAARAMYECNCTLSRKGKGGNRATATDPGAKKTVVVSPTGERVETQSMSEAAKLIAKWYPDAKQCRKYVETINAGKAANAKVFLLSDLNAQRIPANSVEFVGATETAPAA